MYDLRSRTLIVRAYVGEFRRIATGGDIALGRAQARAMAGAAFIGGEIYFARKQGKVVGVAAWYPPGRAAYDR